MQDMEFTVQNGKLWMLQTRNGKRTGLAALKVAVDMVREGLITKEEAVTRVEPGHLDQLLHPMFDKSAKREPIANGLPASPGAAVGQIVFSAADAEAAARQLRLRCRTVRWGGWKHPLCTQGGKRLCDRDGYARLCRTDHDADRCLQ